MEEDETTLPVLDLYVAHYVVHDEFNYQQTGLWHDIVLLELEDHVYLDVYPPACLPRPGNHSRFSGERATVAGWGDTSFQGKGSTVLLEVELPVITNTECERKMKTKLISGQMCAGGEEGRDSCQVDISIELLAAEV